VFWAGGMFNSQAIAASNFIQVGLRTKMCSVSTNQMDSWRIDFPTNKEVDVLDTMTMAESKYTVLLWDRVALRAELIIVEFARTCPTDAYSILAVSNLDLNHYCTASDNCAVTAGRLYSYKLSVSPTDFFAFIAGSHTSYNAGQTNPQ
jgi:hypothetical protein